MRFALTMVAMLILPFHAALAETAEPGDFVLRAIRVNPDQFNLRPAKNYYPDYDWRLVIELSESSAVIHDTYVMMEKGRAVLQTDRVSRFRLVGRPPLVLKQGGQFDLGISGAMKGPNLGEEAGIHSFFSVSDLSAITSQATDSIRPRDLSGQWCHLHAQNPSEARMFRFRRLRDGEGMPGYSPKKLEVNWCGEMGQSYGLFMTFVRFDYERVDRREDVAMPSATRPGARSEPPDFVPGNCAPDRKEGHCSAKKPKTDRAAWTAAHRRHNGCPCLREPHRGAGEGDRECCRIAGVKKWAGDCR